MDRMNSKGFRNWIIFFLLLLLSTLIIYLQVKSVGEKKSNIVEAFCVKITIPLERMFTSAGQNIGSFFYTVFHYRKINEKIYNLERKCSLLERKNLLLAEDKFENNELKELLNLKKKSDEFKIGIASQIISRDAQSWLEKVNIDKGYKDGIRENMAVRSSLGLVGKVTKVFENNSHVTLITSLNMAVPAKIKKAILKKAASNDTSGKKDILGILYGGGRGNLIMKYMDTSSDIKPGDLVVTSGEGEIFSGGEKIGYIEVLLSSKEDLFKSAKVTPFADFNSLEFVWVF